MLTLDELAVIRKLLRSRNEGFSALIEIAGLDPASDLRGSDLSGVKFGEVDLSKFDLTDANLNGADMREVKGIDLANLSGASTVGTILPRQSSVRSLSTVADTHPTMSDFSSKILNILGTTELRRVSNPQDMLAVRKLRESAYTQGDLKISESTRNEADFEPNSFCIVLEFEGAPVSTIRIRHVTAETPESNATSLFPETINDLLSRGVSFVACEAFASGPMRDTLTWLPYLTLRTGVLAAIHFRADYLVQLIRPTHAAFYKRVFYADTLAGPRDLSGTAVSLMATNMRENSRRVVTRYPFFQSSVEEREKLFGPSLEKNDAFFG